MLRKRSDGWKSPRTGSGIVLNAEVNERRKRLHLCLRSALLLAFHTRIHTALSGLYLGRVYDRRLTNLRRGSCRRMGGCKSSWDYLPLGSFHCISQFALVFQSDLQLGYSASFLFSTTQTGPSKGGLFASGFPSVNTRKNRFWFLSIAMAIKLLGGKGRLLPIFFFWNIYFLFIAFVTSIEIVTFFSYR